MRLDPVAIIDSTAALVVAIGALIHGTRTRKIARLEGDETPAVGKLPVKRKRK